MGVQFDLAKALTGISGILVTPFDGQDEVAPQRLKPIIDRAITAGVHILVSNGNTGEFYALTTDEAETMVRGGRADRRSYSAAGWHRSFYKGRLPLGEDLGRSGRFRADDPSAAGPVRRTARHCRLRPAGT
jgi:4-hydroxy-tetrahydrodipicolinate synthase